jgi:hypothetical protein
VKFTSGVFFINELNCVLHTENCVLRTKNCALLFLFAFLLLLDLIHALALSLLETL